MAEHVNDVTSLCFCSGHAGVPVQRRRPPGRAFFASRGERRHSSEWQQCRIQRDIHGAVLDDTQQVVGITAERD